MIRKLKSGEYRLYSRKKNPKTGRRRNLGTFSSRKRPKARARGAIFQAPRLTARRRAGPDGSPEEKGLR